MWNKFKQNKLFGSSAAGTVVMAVCCFTPALVLLFAVLGISSLIGAWLNPILLPALTTFLYLTTYALMRRNEPSRGQDYEFAVRRSWKIVATVWRSLTPDRPDFPSPSRPPSKAPMSL